MRVMPYRDEALALVGVWIIYPALYFAGVSIGSRLGEITGSLPVTMRLAFDVSRANLYCVPSLIGTGCIVLVGRFTPTVEAKRFLWHLITLMAFGFTVASMLCFLTTLRLIR